MSTIASLIYLSLAIFYLVFADNFSVQLQAFFKIIPLLWLLAVYLRAFKPQHICPNDVKFGAEVFTHRQSQVVVAALFFSMLGDVVLALDGKNWFVYGLAAFLLSHLAYITALMPLQRLSPLHSLMLLGVYALFASVMLVLLAPNLGMMLWPVIFYITVILLMSLATWHSKGNNAWLIIGGLMFISSDAAIGISRFYQTFSGQGEFIMITYYAAQYALLTGFAQQRITRNIVVATRNNQIN